MRPSITIPPPTPVPTVIITRSCATSRSCSSWASASAATVASLSTNTGTPSRSRQHVAQRHVLERHVDRRDDPPAFELDHRRHPDADALDRSSRASAADQRPRAARSVLPTPTDRWAPPATRRAAVAQRGHRHLGPPQIDADHVHGATFRSGCRVRAAPSPCSPAAPAAKPARADLVRRRGPNAAATASAFRLARDQEHDPPRRRQRRQRQRDPRNVRLEPGLRDPRRASVTARTATSGQGTCEPDGRRAQAPAAAGRTAAAPRRAARARTRRPRRSGPSSPCMRWTAAGRTRSSSDSFAMP